MSDILARIGLLTPSGAVAGAETVHPDAGLLVDIGEFETLSETQRRLMDKAPGYRQGGRRYRETWREILSHNHERDVLEHAVCTTPAQTKVGVIAKLDAALRQMDGDGAGGKGTIWELPVSAVRDAMALLRGGGRSMSALLSRLAVRQAIPSRETAAITTDAELILLCNRVITLRAEQQALADADPWAPDRGSLHGRYKGLEAQWGRLVIRLGNAERPASQAAVRAVCKLALQFVDRSQLSLLGPWLRVQALVWAAGEDEPVMPPRYTPWGWPVRGDVA